MVGAGGGAGDKRRDGVGGALQRGVGAGGAVLLVKSRQRAVGGVGMKVADEAAGGRHRVALVVGMLIVVISPGRKTRSDDRGFRQFQMPNGPPRAAPRARISFTPSVISISFLSLLTFELTTSELRFCPLRCTTQATPLRNVDYCSATAAHQTLNSQPHTGRWSYLFMGKYAM
jgi:hypothetical protein